MAESSTNQIFHPRSSSVSIRRPNKPRPQPPIHHIQSRGHHQQRGGYFALAVSWPHSRYVYLFYQQMALNTIHNFSVAPSIMLFQNLKNA